MAEGKPVRLLQILNRGEVVAWIDANGDFTCLDKIKMVEAIMARSVMLKATLELRRRVNYARN